MRRGREVPRVFQSLGVLCALNVASVGLALATITSAILSIVFSSTLSLAVGVPTLLCGLLWAIVLRHRATLGRSSVRVGWLASIPLAFINAGIACAMTYAQSERADFVGTVGLFIAGVTFGAIVWIPALIATLVCFGIPLWHAQRMAEKGLAGEERGERLVGIAAAIVSALGLTVITPLDFRPNDPMMEWIREVIQWTLGIGGMTTGTLAAVFAHLRGIRRRAFVDDVEAGNVVGYRVETAPAGGRVLIRVTSVGEGYRVANFEESVHEEPVDSKDATRHDDGRTARRASNLYE